MSIKICTFNVKGLNDPSKRQQLFQWLKLNKYSICLLQEVHCEEMSYDKWKKDWGDELFLSGNSTNSTGVGILINSNFTYTVKAYNNIIDGRMQSLKININEKDYILLNVYAPNNATEHIQFLTTIEDFIISNDSDTLIIGGDFNTVSDINKDKKNGNINSNKKNRDKLNNIIQNNDVNDIWRILNPETLQYTWHSNHKPPIFCRLDFFLVSNNIVNSIKECKITTGIRSDHSIVYFNIIVDNQPRGPGYFKLNNSVILEKDYQDMITRSITDITNINKEANPNTLWEIIKGTIRNETIIYTSTKKKKKVKIEMNLKNDIDNLEKELSNNQDNETILNKIKEKKSELDEIIKEHTRGILLRAKAEWIEGAEKNTKYFSNLEKKRSENKTIKRLSNNFREVTNPKEVLEEINLFYKRLYSKDSTVQNDDIFLTGKSKSVLNEEEKGSCEGFITELECSNALKEMNNGKSPGSDGITVEFYKIFWNTIKTYYINSINYSYQNNTLTTMQKQGIITLLPKKDKDLTSLGNWRPISLLNTDYKIATKTLANRMKKVLHNIIINNQTGFLKGRYIGENIRTIFEVIEYLNDEDKPGLIFFADFEKAFDSIDHNFILKTLAHFNFGDSFINWIRLFYLDAQSCVINNGYMSEFFDIKRGVRQGCPLSPYLFILTIEILYMSVKADNDIKGITMYDREMKNTAFADDATFMMDGSYKTFTALIKQLNNFSKISGLKLNNKKSVILRSGSLKNSAETFNTNKDFTWTSEGSNTLGIVFSNNRNKYHELNLIPKIQEFCNCLQRWKRHNLSIIGKIAVIKTFALPKLIYPLTVLESPTPELISLINTNIYDYLWDGKPDKISRKTIIQDYKDGGLKMIDLNMFMKAIKAGWVKRLTDNENDGDWKHIYINKLNKLGGKLIFDCNLNEKDLTKTKYNCIPKFLKEILQAWSNLNFENKPTEINNQILWNNSFINNNNNTVFYNEWYSKGIKYINNIYDKRLKSFYTFQAIKAKYLLQNSDFLKYYTLLESIPKAWKQKMKTENITDNNIQDNLLQQVQTSKSTTKLLYNKMLKEIQNNAIIKPHIKWEKESTHIDWGNAHTIPFKALIDTKLRTFQYKYIMRIIPNNEFLYKCKIEKSSLCDFCAMNVETNKHLFWDCQYSRALWTNLEVYLNQKQVKLNLNYMLISFGYTEWSSYSTLLNTILIYAKYFIYKNKFTKTIPLFNNFIKYLKHVKNIEQIIAMAKDKVEQHNSKWETIQLNL